MREDRFVEAALDVAKGVDEIGRLLSTLGHCLERSEKSQANSLTRVDAKAREITIAAKDIGQNSAEISAAVLELRRGVDAMCGLYNSHLEKMSPLADALTGSELTAISKYVEDSRCVVERSVMFMAFFAIINAIVLFGLVYALNPKVLRERFERQPVAADQDGVIFPAPGSSEKHTR